MAYVKFIWEVPARLNAYTLALLNGVVGTWDYFLLHDLSAIWPCGFPHLVFNVVLYNSEVP